MTRKGFFSALVFLLVLTMTQALSAKETFDHSLYDKVLHKYVDQGRVDYESLKKERRDLDLYITSLGDFDKKDYDALNHSEKIAFWINAYNAITLKVIIDHYPITRSGIAGLAFPPSSIRQIPGAWTKIAHRVVGENVTLNKIEHEILRKEFKEPRIHMALVCAAKGCPPLRNEAYTGSRLDAQLDDQAKTFLANSEKFRIDRASGLVNLSPIFDWFGGDFKARYEAGGPSFLKDKEKAVIGFILSYVSAENKTFFSKDGYKIKHLGYDWSLNEKGK